jgi:TolA-binding protein
MPLDKIQGFWSLLRVKAHMAQSHYAQAAAEVETLVGVSQGSSYAPQLLMLAADAYKALGKADAMTKILRRIVEKYPESSLAAQASARLKGV